MTIGNPAPLGLFAFGITTAMLMYVETGWAEPEFEQFVAGYAIYYGGLCQLLVAVLEIIKGSSFSFAVFGSYGAFWMGWATIVFESHRDGDSTFVSTSQYPHGKAAWLASFGVLSLGFFPVIMRKNMCLVVTFGLLILTFFLLSSAVGSGSKIIKEIAGYMGFLTALAAWYTGLAELVNEEYGKMILPGLEPLVIPSHEMITKKNMASRVSYNPRTNTLFLTFRHLQIRTLDDVRVVREAVEETIKKSNAPEGKVYVVVDYYQTVIGNDIAETYWEMVQSLQDQYYISASRFHVSSFVTGFGTYNGIESGSNFAAIKKTINNDDLNVQDTV